MGPKTRLPKHVREWMKENYVAEVQHPEKMLSQYRSLMLYFMEKYEQEQKKRQKAEASAGDWHERFLGKVYGWD